MKPISTHGMRDAAAYATLGARWREAYLHDLRGELQALRSAVELLARAAKAPAGNDAAVERISALAVRTMNNHETSLVNLLDRLTPHPQPTVRIDVAASVGEVLKFVRSDAWNKSIEFRLALTPGILILAEPETLRRSLLAMVSMAIDGLEPDSAVHLAVERRDTNAVIELKCALPRPAVTHPKEPWFAAGQPMPAYEMLLGLTEDWVGAHGGRLEVHSTGEFTCVVRILHPIAPA